MLLSMGTFANMDLLSQALAMEDWRRVAPGDSGTGPAPPGRTSAGDSSA